MAITVANFKTRFPEYTSVADERIQLFLDDAIAELCESAWGDRYETAVYYLAAHFLALALATEAGNPSGLSPVTSAGADGLSTSFGRFTYTSVSQAYWESTSYGREFMRMKRTAFAGGFVATLNCSESC